MIRFTVDLLAEFKAAGYSTYKLRMNRIFGEASMQKMRQGELISWAELDRSCALLHCQPGDLLEWVPDSDSENSGEGEQ